MARSEVGGVACGPVRFDPEDEGRGGAVLRLPSCFRSRRIPPKPDIVPRRPPRRSVGALPPALPPYSRAGRVITRDEARWSQSARPSEAARRVQR